MAERVDANEEPSRENAATPTRDLWGVACIEELLRLPDAPHEYRDVRVPTYSYLPRMGLSVRRVPQDAETGGLSDATQNSYGGGTHADVFNDTVILIDLSR